MCTLISGRWSVLEFMTEAHTLHTSPAKPFDVINGVKGGGAGMKSGEISFGNAGVGNAGDRRGIVSGDYVRVVPVDASEFMFEAQVVKISAPLVVKPIDRVDYDHFIKHSNPTTTFRIEKLANRVWWTLCTVSTFQHLTATNHRWAFLGSLKQWARLLPVPLKGRSANLIQQSRLSER